MMAQGCSLDCPSCGELTVPGFQWNKEQAAQGVCVTDPETVLGAPGEERANSEDLRQGP